MICIYHSRDLDGYCSGAIVKKKFPDATLIGYDYGEPIPELPTGEAVIIIDVSMPMKDMEHIAENSNWQLTWIDHHVSAINEFKNYVGDGEAFCVAVLEVGIAACEIAWKYYFPDFPITSPVQLLGEYDTFRNKDQDRFNKYVLPFQYGMRSICTSAESFPSRLLDRKFTVYDVIFIEDINKTGLGILKYQMEQNKKLCEKAFHFNFLGHRAICLNTTTPNSLTFESVYDPAKHDVMMPFSFTGKFWVFSLYTETDNVDCSVLAKKMGGGGHRKAAGFQVDQIRAVFEYEN